MSAPVDHLKCSDCGEYVRPISGIDHRSGDIFTVSDYGIACSCMSFKKGRDYDDPIDVSEDDLPDEWFRTI